MLSPRRRFRMSLLVALLFLLLLALTFSHILPPWASYVAIGVAILGAVFYPLLLWKEYRLFSRMELGLNLLHEQAYSSKLTLTGNAQIDKVVQLFNLLLEQLKEERLHFNEQALLLSALIEASPMGILLLNGDEQIQRLNPAARTQLGIPHGRRLVGLQLDAARKYFALKIPVLTTGEVCEVHGTSASIYRIHCDTFYDRGYQQKYWLIETLTEATQAHERSTYQKLIRMCAHEVNNTAGSLHSLLESSIQLLEDSNPANTLYSDALRTGEERLDELVLFMGRIAELAKLPEPNPTWQSVDDFMQELLARHSLLYREKHIALSYHPQPSLTPTKANLFYGDRILLMRVFENLLKNASESMTEEGGEILLQTAIIPHKAEWEWVVADNGKPIPDAQLPQLFSPFFTTKVDGQGLGLLLCREILQTHGFPFSLRTDSDGWTRFRISGIKATTENT